MLEQWSRFIHRHSYSITAFFMWGGQHVLLMPQQHFASLRHWGYYWATNNQLALAARHEHVIYINVLVAESLGDLNFTAAKGEVAISQSGPNSGFDSDDRAYVNSLRNIPSVGHVLLIYARNYYCGTRI